MQWRELRKHATIEKDSKELLRLIYGTRPAEAVGPVGRPARRQLSIRDVCPEPVQLPSMLPRKQAQAAFMSAVVLLVLSALATFFTVNRLLESEKWVKHSYEVRATLGDIDAAVLRAGRARAGFVISGTEDFLDQFEAAAPDVPNNIQKLQQLTKDNPQQQKLAVGLAALTARRVELIRDSIQAKKDRPLDRAAQAEIERQTVPISSEITAVMQQMRDQEQALLGIREKTLGRWFSLAVVTLSASFLLAIVLFSVNHRFLSAELLAREQAEQAARDSEESLRHLSVRLLQLQDDERRKFSRELHDSLGQYLAGVKMNLAMFSTRGHDELLVEAIELLDQSIAETRTISHLLHPPLLDEAGLSSAARWYLEGFAQRSGIAVKVEMPDDVTHLPRPVALCLFRIMQESLTNIHRHSGSTKAEVTLTLLPQQVVLKVRDFGKGIPPELLRRFEAQGTNSGVGLAGMRERMRELGGQLVIRPCVPGTSISVTLPLFDEAPKTSAAAD
jgi:signal transduction histidine kinase